MLIILKIQNRKQERKCVGNHIERIREEMAGRYDQYNYVYLYYVKKNR